MFAILSYFGLLSFGIAFILAFYFSLLKIKLI
nr:cytochrome b6-f complex subunit 6 [Ostreobium quekettii]UXE30734.1 cytochrome b6-f complex subunit 6 [Ostreobium quekettii]UXE30810.1 cytochrome b6-f complex subunit 6 [Ostreobium quekettii]UXE30886.1 cytochrome b6-f complex subunit 6 [Ostreobium quekettii]